MATEKAPVEVGQDVPGHDIDADDALQATQTARNLGALDAATSTRILRRVDMVLMPMLCLIYGLNFLDKTTLSYASVTGIQKDIGLKGNQYSWLGSLFYFGYLGFEYPAVRLLQRFPLAKYSGFCIIAWGITLSCFAAVHNFAGAVVIRLLLGVFEASVSPGWALFTSQWYTKEEQGVRTAWWVSFNGFAQIFGGLVAYGVAHHAKTAGYAIAPWKIIYILTGAITIVCGIIFLAIIPDSPLSARWLSENDRILAVERVRVNQQGIGNKHFKIYQFKEALLDPLTWAFFFMALSLLYGTISGAIEVVILLGWAYLTRFYHNRILWGMGGLVVALFGACLIVGLPHNSSGRLAGFYLAQFYAVALVSLISMLATNVAGYTKKTTVSGLFFIGYCTGNIIGPQTFRQKDAPYYVPAEITLIVCYGLVILDMLFIYWYYRRQNGKKAAIRATALYKKLENQEFLDLTDGENPEFVYVL